MGAFMPGARISQAHGTTHPIDPETGARAAVAFAMYHPAAALRAPEIERASFADMATVPAALLRVRERRQQADLPSGAADLAPVASPPPAPAASSAPLSPVPASLPAPMQAAAAAEADPAPQLTLF